MSNRMKLIRYKGRRGRPRKRTMPVPKVILRNDGKPVRIKICGPWGADERIRAQTERLRREHST